MFLHAGTQGVALFKRSDNGPAGGDIDRLALNVTTGTYESLKAELEAMASRSAAGPATTGVSISPAPTATAYS